MVVRCASFWFSDMGRPTCGSARMTYAGWPHETAGISLGPEIVTCRSGDLLWETTLNWWKKKFTKQLIEIRKVWRMWWTVQGPLISHIIFVPYKRDWKWYSLALLNEELFYLTSLIYFTIKTLNIYSRILIIKKKLSSHFFPLFYVLN